MAAGNIVVGKEEKKSGMNTWRCSGRYGGDRLLLSCFSNVIFFSKDRCAIAGCGMDFLCGRLELSVASERMLTTVTIKYLQCCY